MYQASWGKVAGSLVQWWNSGNRASRQGFPEPLADGQARNPPFGHLVPFGTQILRQIPRNDWGADAYAYTGGKVTVNPIGAGVVVRHKPPVLSGPVHGVQLGVGLLFNNQMQNQGIQPGQLPLYTPANLAGLLNPIAAQAVVPGASAVVSTSGMI